MHDTSTQLQEIDNLIDIFEKTIYEDQMNFKNNMEESGLSIKLAEYLITIPDEDIKSMDLKQIDSILIENGCSTDTIKSEYFHTGDRTLPFLDFSIDILLKIKEKMSRILDAKNNLKDIKENRLDISRSFMEMVKSPEYREARLNEINKLKSRVETLEDETEKSKLTKKLLQIEKSQVFSFLNERLHKYGEKEATSIMNSFFDSARGANVMEKYAKKLKRLEINRYIHTSFFNIEETFLPERFEPFNNFFLFHVIRFIAYIDVNSDEDILYMSSILGALHDLVTGESTEEEKNTILSVIKDFYSFYDNDDCINIFKEKNASYKYHPDRMKVEKENLEKINETIKMELGHFYNEEEVGNDPKKYFTKILEEKAKMLDFVKDHGTEEMKLKLRDSVRYEDVFTMFDEIQTRSIDTNINNNESVDTVTEEFATV